MTSSLLLRRIARTASRLRKDVSSICGDLKASVLSDPVSRQHVVFGPVPSRRLGRSLGVNNITTKTCSYDCIYCQAGPTTCLSTCRQSFVSSYEVFDLVRRKLGPLAKRHIPVDYITFVSSGEPTLDLGLSKEIRLLREFGHKIAVLTNSSLLWNDNVKEDLLFADYVSVKLDTVTEATWHRINRPHRRLQFQKILDGVADFSRSFSGVLTTETMLVQNTNDTLAEVAAIGEYLTNVKRSTSYFAIPTRPPARSDAVAPKPYTLNALSRFIVDNIPAATMLCHPEGTDFEGAGDIEAEIQGILSVHPMSEDAILSFVQRNGGRADTLERMVSHHDLTAVNFQGTRFYTGTRETLQDK